MECQCPCHWQYDECDTCRETDPIKHNGENIK